ncbi:MAG: hypothetical protein QGG40_08465 [Myxococcota bacterium]|jgi:UDP:flavonoid glycosyltransferase YjiC (YdhE family)|nr:hypothetical protein [Myxococcota bacterium]
MRYTQPMAPRVALVCSAHGFGHLTRQVALGQALQTLGAGATFFTHAPSSLVHEILPDAPIVDHRVDVGIAQRDSLTEDLVETRRQLSEQIHDEAIDELAGILAAYDRVVVDIAPPALEAARRAGVPVRAMGNFDWAWIYRHYPDLTDWAERFARWQAPHVAAQLWPGPDLEGFREVARFGLLARRCAPHRWAFQQPDQRAVLVSFGGLGLEIETWLPRIPGVTWVLAQPMPRLDRADCVYIEEIPYPSLVAGADAVLTKPGYGILAECMLAGTPIVWVDRGPFPEAPYLEPILRDRGDVQVDPTGRRLDLPGIPEGLLTVWSRAGRRPSDPGEGPTAEALRLAHWVLDG